jgi:hypothetical protein
MAEDTFLIFLTVYTWSRAGCGGRLGGGRPASGEASIRRRRLRGRRWGARQQGFGLFTTRPLARQIAGAKQSVIRYS